MPHHGWLTPETIPGAVLCRALFIPDDRDWLAIVTGALLDLTFPYNWEEYGAITPTEAAARMQEMVDEFTFRKTGCRMIGELIAYAGASSPYPTLWLPCNGTSVLRADYPDLFAVIGTAYGAVDLSHFNLPDLRGVTLIGQGAGYTLANEVGEAEHTLTEAEIPSHAHTVHSHLTGLVVAPGELPVTTPALIDGVTGYTGGSGAHNNMQRSLPITYLIVAKDR